MNERESTTDLAVRLWQRMPVTFAIAIGLGCLGVDSLLTATGVWDAPHPALRYIGAVSGSLAAYWLAADWRRDARERERRKIDRAEA